MRNSPHYPMHERSTRVDVECAFNEKSYSGFREPRSTQATLANFAPYIVFIFICIISFVKSTAVANDESVNFKGQVLERGTRTPLRGATVYLPDQGLTATTNAEGRFELSGVAFGKVRVQIVESRHKKYEVIEEFAKDQIVEMTAYLQKTIASGKEIVVIGEGAKKEVVKRVLQKEEITTVPGTFGDPLRVLQNMPGMARPAYLSGALLVRGANPNDSVVLIDGVPVPLLYHLGSGPSVVTPSFVEQINFYPGIFGAKYGHSIGGIVDVDTHVPTIARAHGELKVDMLDARLYTESPLGEASKYGTLTLAARHSYIDAWLPLVMKSTGTIPYYWDYQGRYSLQMADQHIDATVFGSDDIYKIANKSTVPTQGYTLNNQTGFHRARISWSTRTAQGWTIALAPMIGISPTISETTNDNIETKIKVTPLDAGLRGFARKELSSTTQLEMGIEGYAARYDLHFESTAQPTAINPTPAPSIREQKVYGGAGAMYIETVWSPLNTLHLIPGVRVEEYKLPVGYINSVEPRLATRYEIADGVTLKGGMGLYRKAPDAERLDQVLGNQNLGLEESRQMGAGIEYQLPFKTLLDVQTYYSWRSHLTVHSRDIVLRDGAYFEENFNNSGRGRAYGLEFLLKHDVTERFYGWLSYTLSRAEQQDKITGEYTPTNFDQTHIVNAVASYKFSDGWEFGARFRLSTGRPETPIIGATYMVDSDRFLPVYGAVGSQRGATFNSLDVRIERLWTFDVWRLSTYFDVQNVFNADNPEAVLWDYRYKKSEPVRGLPILPVLGVLGEF